MHFFENENKTRASVFIYTCLLVSVTILTALYGYGHIIDGDVSQILKKACRFVEFNEIVHYGNAASSGSSGHVPGSFSSLATGLPMKLWHSPWSALGLLFVFHIVSWVLLMQTLRQALGPLGLFAFSVFYLLSPWRAAEVFLWNPGYVFIVSALHFFTAFQMRSQRSSLWSAVHVLSLVLGLQIHPSVVILGLASLFLWMRKEIRLAWGGVFLGALLGGLTLVPFLQLATHQPELIPKPGVSDSGYLFFGLLNIYPVLKGFWYWILFGSLVFQADIFEKIHFQWISDPALSTIVDLFWSVIKYSVGLLSVFVSYLLGRKYLEQNWSALLGPSWRSLFWRESCPVLHLEPRVWCALYGGVVLMSSTLAVAISPSVPVDWHLLYVFPFGLFPLAFAFDQRGVDIPILRWKKKDVLKIKALYKFQLLAAVAVYLVIFNLFAALGSKKHSLNKNLQESYLELCRPLEKKSAGSEDTR